MPLKIDAFRNLLATRTFTNGTDRQLVVGLYDRTIHRAYRGSTKLLYQHLDADSITGLADLLPLCERLEYLAIRDSTFDDTSLAAFAAALDAVPTLKHLRIIRGTGISVAGMRALGRASASQIKDVHLRASDLSSEALLAFFAEIKARKDSSDVSWPSLGLLEVRDTAHILPKDHREIEAAQYDSLLLGKGSRILLAECDSD